MSEEQLNDAMEIAKTNALISIAQSLGRIEERMSGVFDGLEPLVKLLQNPEVRDLISNLPMLAGALGGR